MQNYPLPSLPMATTKTMVSIFGLSFSGPEKGVIALTGGISRISKISKFYRISRKWSDSLLLSTVWGFSRILILWNH